MSYSRLTPFAVLAALALAAAAWVSRAGDLNPPPGPVTPTMHTLSEIYAAVVEAGQGGCGLGTPGEARLDPLVTISGLPGQGPADSFAGIGFKMEPRVALAPDGTPTGPLALGQFVITKNADPVTPRLAQALVEHTLLSEVRLDFNDAMGVYFSVRLENVRVVSDTFKQAARCGGGSYHQETLTLAAARVTWTHVRTGVTFSAP